jgi:membrane-bound lytic murein transglycosylase B
MKNAHQIGTALSIGTSARDRGVHFVLVGREPRVRRRCRVSAMAATWPEAQALGVSRATFDAARGLNPICRCPISGPGRPQAPQRARPTRPDAGRPSRGANIALPASEGASCAQYAATLEGIEKRFGVPGPVVLATGARNRFRPLQAAPQRIRVLATPGLCGCADMFRRNSLALKMAQEGRQSCGDAAPGEARWGSPSSCRRVLLHGVDFDGDGA